ncbi:MAG: cobyric acid synthase [Filifactoraceae bacterium]
MAKKIMIQGTTSNAGKSLIVAGLCRIFQRQGYKVAPYKPQNMALNSFITKEGLEIGRAQAMQAEACKIEPKANMNSILLKPTKQRSIQVIVQGKVVGNMSSSQYHKYKKSLLPIIKTDFQKLEEEYDIIIIEGAGSSAEINIEDDISNMLTADLVDAPVIIVGDIDRGGVFASIYGTIMLQEDKYKNRIKGYIINKYRGEKEMLKSGIEKLTALTSKPCLGIQMYESIDIDEEDGISQRFQQIRYKDINIACIKLPHISNYTDLGIFERIKGVAVNYVETKEALEFSDIIIIPGSKNTIADLKWLKEKGLDKVIKAESKNKIVFGICGGYQILGKSLEDPHNIEEGGTEEGLGLLDSKTIFENTKNTTQTEGRINTIKGRLKALSNLEFKGYEIHNGVSSFKGAIEEKATVYGTYVHGIFDESKIAEVLIKTLAEEKNLKMEINIIPQNQYKENQYEILADTLEKNLDIVQLKKIMEI